MLDITIVSVGHLKEAYWQNAADEYLKRLNPYAKITIVEVPEEKISSVTDRKKILAREGEKIKRAIPKEATLIALDRSGATYSSPDWAGKLEEWSTFGKPLVFVIGGPLGLAYEILKRAHQLVSFSNMTFTHQIIRVLLLEQIYRGSMINHGKTYHY